ncbi:alpha/beta hydrolase [Coraliomargarita algicola]|uniref:Alpha/beta hydrolase n=1 Tax=Coraliomargarita algicola TaxID=3092156 RepID=A0ABZ0RL44_9BACT|nr:alpha/beta hydrolase [Coraliomargarita sp. J2-16]WPJ96930.1 alpha/beta hydrolase [Coraliomargarita sp. J2-16]
MYYRLRLIASCLMMSLSLTAQTIELWPEGALNTEGMAEDDVPTLELTFPAEGTANGAAVVICPGGSYRHLVMGHEGRSIAQWFNSIGVTAAVLKYRIPAEGHPHPAPMEDVQRALQIMRSNSENWDLDPSKVGVLGCSAGGHLASTAATHFIDADPTTADPVARVSSRPDFLVLLYPVISMQRAITHSLSRQNLIGKNPSSEFVDLLSNELQVDSETPPTFIVAADNDTAVKAENSVRFYLALRQANVPAELHLYKEGGHGFGFRKQRTLPVHHWPDLLQDWLCAESILPSSQLD